MSSDPLRKMPQSFQNDDSDVSYVPSQVNITVVGTKGDANVKLTHNSASGSSNFEPGSTNKFTVGACKDIMSIMFMLIKLII